MPKLPSSSSSTEARKLEIFVREQIAEGASRFELRQLAAGNSSGSRVKSWRVKEGEPADAEALAGLVFDVACDEAEQLAGPVRYALLAFGAGESQYAARALFRVSGAADGIGEEEGTLAAALASSTRHTEAMFRLSTMTIGEVLDHYRASDARKAKRIEELEGRSVKIFELLESLESAAHTRRIEQAKQEQSSEFRSAILNQFLPLIPAVVGRLHLTGGPPVGTPAEKTLLEEQLLAFLQSLTPEQMASATVAQRALVESLLEQAAVIAARREEEERAKEAARAAHANGAASPSPTEEVPS